MVYKFLRIIIGFCIIFLSSCSENRLTEGNYIFDHTLQNITVGMSQADVKNLLGSPTLIASFNEPIWYYAYETSTRKLRFLAKNIQDAKIVRLTFNSNKEIKRIDITTQQNFKEIPFDEEQTITSLKKARMSRTKKATIDSF